MPAARSTLIRSTFAKRRCKRNRPRVRVGRDPEQAALLRPLSPIYQPQLTWIASIANRATGGALSTRALVSSSSAKEAPRVFFYGGAHAGCRDSSLLLYLVDFVFCFSPFFPRPHPSASPPSALLSSFPSLLRSAPALIHHRRRRYVHLPFTPLDASPSLSSSVRTPRVTSPLQYPYIPFVLTPPAHLSLRPSPPHLSVTHPLSVPSSPSRSLPHPPAHLHTVRPFFHPHPPTPSNLPPFPHTPRHAPHPFTRHSFRITRASPVISSTHLPSLPPPVPPAFVLSLPVLYPARSFPTRCSSSPPTRHVPAPPHLPSLPSRTLRTRFSSLPPFPLILTFSLHITRTSCVFPPFLSSSRDPPPPQLSIAFFLDSPLPPPFRYPVTIRLASSAPFASPFPIRPSTPNLPALPFPRSPPRRPRRRLRVGARDIPLSSPQLSTPSRPFPSRPSVHRFGGFSCAARVRLIRSSLSTIHHSLFLLPPSLRFLWASRISVVSTCPRAVRRLERRRAVRVGATCISVGARRREDVVDRARRQLLFVREACQPHTALRDFQRKRQPRTCAWIALARVYSFFPSFTIGIILLRLFTALLPPFPLPSLISFRYFPYRIADLFCFLFTVMSLKGVYQTGYAVLADGGGDGVLVVM